LRGSWRIARVAGIDVRIHVTFPILFAWVGLTGYLDGGAALAMLGVALLPLLFAIVVLHELGHALVARAYGIGTREILLLPIGGVARLERIPDRPRQELAIALAGPAVNLVLAAVALAFVGLAGAWSWATDPQDLPAAALATLIAANGAMFTFNLLPAFPMDGGRVLRALLALRLDYVIATRIAARVGQAMALLLAVVGLVSNPVLMLGALFVYSGAALELSAVELRAAAGNLPVRAVMSRSRWAVHPEMALDAAVRFSLAGGPRIIPVVQADRLVGTVSRQDLLAALIELGAFVPIREVMRTDLPVSDADEPLLPAVERATAHGAPVLLVVRDGYYLGQVDIPRLRELLPAFALALQRNGSTGANDGARAPNATSAF